MKMTMKRTKLGSNIILEFLVYWVEHDDGKRRGACWILNSNADQMRASFKRFRFRLLANLTLKWQPIVKCVMFWSGSLWGPFRATVVVHLYWRVVPFWYEDTHGAETDAGGMRTALSTGRNTDCKDNGGAGRRTWSCNMPPRVEKTEPRLLSESFCYDSDMFEWCPKHLTALSKRMQVYRQDMAGQQASTCPAQNLPNFPAMAGGLEFVAEETDEGSRLRARRIAYSAKAVTGTKRAFISEPKI